MVMINEIVRTATKQVVELLVAKRYDKLVELTKGNRMTTEMIETAVRDYKRDLSLPPEAAYDRLDVVEVAKSVPRRWSVRCALWTKQEGRSDLSVELTVVDTDNGCQIELDDIRVL